MPVNLTATNGWHHNSPPVYENNRVGWSYGYDVTHAGVTYGAHYIYRNGVWIYFGQTKAGTCNETTITWDPNKVDTSAYSEVYN